LPARHFSAGFTNECELLPGVAHQQLLIVTRCCATHWHAMLARRLVKPKCYSVRRLAGEVSSAFFRVMEVLVKRERYAGDNPENDSQQYL
jgi:hypothetical protein